MHFPCQICLLHHQTLKYNRRSFYDGSIIMKKCIAALSLFIAISSASASSSLKLSFTPTDKVFSTITLNHNTTNSNYRVYLQVTLRDTQLQTIYSSEISGSYTPHLNKLYLVDNQRQNALNDFTSAKGTISFYSCSDSSFKSCIIIQQTNLNITYTKNTITNVLPNTFDIAV